MSPKNVRSGASLAVALLACCVALNARAGEKTDLTPELVVEQDYDSNIFFTTHDPNDSLVTIIRPSLNIENTGTLGSARLYGYVSEHIYWSESKLNGFDRGVGGELSRQILPRTTIFGNGSYQRIAAHLEIRGPDVVTTTPSPAPGIPGETVVQPGQLIEGASPDINLAQGVFGVRQDLTPRTQLELSGGPFSIDYLPDPGSISTWRDRSGWFGGVTLTHLLTPLDKLTFQLSANDTDFADVSGGSFFVADPTDPHTISINTGRTTSDLQSLTVGWQHAWSEVWNTTIAVGGRRLHTRTSDALRPLTRVGISSFGPTPFVDYTPNDFDETGPGVVGSVVVQRILPRGGLALSYQRETRTTSSLFASNTNVDTIALGWTHRLSSDVTFSLRGSLEHYESVNRNPALLPASYVAGSYNPITGPEYSCADGILVNIGSGVNRAGQCRISSRSNLTSDSYNAVARIDWRLRKRLSTFLVVRYQDRNGDELLFGQDYDKFNVGIGFRYDYALGF